MARVPSSPVDTTTVDQALCDAQHIGSIDADRPARAHQDIPPATVRFVWHRDGGRCQTPGCRSSRGLEIHHIIHREDGGSHDPTNLSVRCSSCHRAHHAGRLGITGTAPDRIITRRRDEGESGSASRFDDAVVRTQTRDALVSLGWKPAIAKAAVEAAASRVGREATLETWIREALRQCPLRKSSRVDRRGGLHGHRRVSGGQWASEQDRRPTSRQLTATARRSARPARGSPRRRAASAGR